MKLPIAELTISVDRPTRYRVAALTSCQGFAKLSTAVLFLFLPLLAFCFTGYGQGPSGPAPKKARTAADYTPRTLKQIAAISNAGVRKQTEAEVLTGDLFPSRVRATFTGSKRPLSEARKNVILHWAQRYAGDPVHYTGPYQDEMLFRQSGAAHWLVIHKDLLSRFENEIKAGDVVELNLIRLGAFRSKQRNWVLLVESIATPLMSEIRCQRSDVRMSVGEAVFI